MVESLTCPNLGFGSGHKLGIVGLSPALGSELGSLWPRGPALQPL